MVPVSQATAAALALAAGAEALAAADGAVVGAAAEAAVLGEALEPELEQAANANTAAKANAARRFGVGIVTRGSSGDAARRWRAVWLGHAGLGVLRAPLGSGGRLGLPVLTAPPW